MNVLFICNQNRHRSKTAEVVFRSQFDVASAGLYNETPVTEVQIAWADLVVVMEEEQRAELGRRFPKLYLQKRILSLDVPDTYSYGQPELIHLLQKRMAELV
jgi:predicted protein tyrosine phosphatase